MNHQAVTHERWRTDERVFDTIRRITPKMPMRGCFAAREFQDVVAEGDRFLNVHRCEDSCCIHCARRIARRRRNEVAKMIAEAFALGVHVYFVTLTQRHDVTDWLPDQKKANQIAWSHLVDSSRPWQRMRDDFGILGHRWSAETTLSARSGWHPHRHVLFFSSKQFSPTEAFEFHRAVHDRWAAGLVKAGMRAPSFFRGVQIEQVDNDLEDILKVAGYITKIGDGIAAELTGSLTKRGRGDSVTFFQMAEHLAAADHGKPRGARAFLWLPTPEKGWGVGTTVTQERDRSIWVEGPRPGTPVLPWEERRRLNADITAEERRLWALRRQVPDDDDIEDFDAHARLLRRIRHFEDDIEWMRAERERVTAESEWRRDRDTGEEFRVGEVVRSRVNLPDRDFVRELVEYMIHSGDTEWGGSQPYRNPASADEERWNRIVAASQIEDLDAFESSIAYHLGFDSAEEPEARGGDRPASGAAPVEPSRYFIDGDSFMRLIHPDAEMRCDLRIALTQGFDAVRVFRERTGLIIESLTERARELEDSDLRVSSRDQHLQSREFGEMSNRRPRAGGRPGSTLYRGRAPRASSGPRRATARSDHSVDLSRRARSREWRRSLRELQAAYQGWTWSSSTDQRDPELSSATTRAV